MRLGNDVVDLGDPANRASAANPAFHHRILSPLERTRVTLSGVRELWAYWAAKEAVYKALKPACPALVFAHREFAVQTQNTFHHQQGRARGVVTVADRAVDVIWDWTADWIHCVTAQIPMPAFCVAPIDALRRDLRFASISATESLPDESVAARVLAYMVLGRLGVCDVHIARRREPGSHPVVHVRGVQVDEIALSLSHDHRFAAAAARRV